MGQKQVASLLGHSTSDQVSRYERGEKFPSLKTALKLGLIYGIPIRVLLDGYFEACREEIKIEDKRINNAFHESDFCTIEEKLNPESVNQTDLDKAYTHSASIIRKRAEKLGHI